MSSSKKIVSRECWRVNGSLLSASTSSGNGAAVRRRSAAKKLQHSTGSSTLPCSSSAARRRSSAGVAFAATCSEFLHTAGTAAGSAETGCGPLSSATGTNESSQRLTEPSPASFSSYLPDAARHGSAVAATTNQPTAKKQRASSSNSGGGPQRPTAAVAQKRKRSSVVLVTSIQNNGPSIVDLDTFLAAASGPSDGSEVRAGRTQPRHSSGGGKKVASQKSLANRLVCHGRNWVPVGEDDEETMDCDYSWMKEFNRHNMNEFSDVNRSEKDLLNLWNNFCYSIQGRSSLHLEEILTRFLAHHTAQIWQHNLLGNFHQMVSNMLLRGTLSQMSCYRVLSALQRHSLQLAASGSPPTTTSLPGDSVETDNMIVQQCEGEDEDEAGRWRSSSRNYRKPSTTVLNHGQCLAEAAANAPGCHQRGSGSLLTSPPPRANSCRAAECKAVAGSRQPLATVAGENNNVRRGLLGALEGNDKGFSFVSEQPPLLEVETLSTLLGRTPLPGSSGGSEHSSDSLSLQLSDTEDQDSRSEIQNFFSSFSDERQAAAAKTGSSQKEPMELIDLLGEDAAPLDYLLLFRPGKRAADNSAPQPQQLQRPTRKSAKTFDFYSGKQTPL